MLVGLLFILVCAFVPPFRRFLLWVVGFVIFFIVVGALQGTTVSPLLAKVLFIGFMLTPVWLALLIVAKAFVKRRLAKRAARAAEATNAAQRRRYGTFKVKATK